MDNISILLERLASGSILMNNNIIYDEIIEQDGNISYDPGTGIVTLSETGKYCVFWWVATQTSTSTNGIGFNLVTSQADQVVGNSPIKTDEPTGFGIIDVNTAPITLSIQNASNNTIYFSTITQTKASLMIVKISETSLISSLAYGGLSDEIITSFNFEPGEEIQIPITSEMVFENIVYGTNNIEITMGGNYEIYYMINFAGSGVSITVQPTIKINGLSIPVLSQACNLASTGNVIATATAIVALNPGDLIGLYLVSATGGTISLLPETNVILTVNKLSYN